MTGHIIGAPSEKRGATFAVVNDPRGRPSLPWRVRTPNGQLLPGFAREHQANECAARLNVEAPTPVEPELDPVMTTYPQLGEGQWFEFTRSGVNAGPRLMCNSPSRGHLALPHNDFVTSCGQYDDEPVRVLTPPEVAAHILKAAGLSASVVVHEEPVPEMWEALEDIGLPTTDPDWLRAVAQQSTALLAQRDASPASEPEHRTLGGALTGGTAELKPNLPEDRSKPAAGFTVGLCGARPWTVTDSLCQLRSTHTAEVEAIAFTWELYDAQQAGKGGESP